MNSPIELAHSPVVAAAPDVGARSVPTYLTIDNGFTGAMCRLSPNDDLVCRPVPVQDCGSYRQLDIEAGVTLLRGMICIDGEPIRNLLVVYEQSPITPLFGAKNNFVNGQNNEFWRVTLALLKLPHIWVNPKVWQKHVFSGIRGDDTKVKAEIARRRRFPQFSTAGYTRSQIEGINDAVCIALWARETGK